MEKIEQFFKKRQNILVALIIAAASLAMLVFVYFSTVSPLKAEHHSLSVRVTLFAATALIIPLVSYILIIVLKADRVKTFAVFAIILALLMSFAIPLSCAPDEWTHFTNAYNYSSILMGKDSMTVDELLIIREADLANESHDISIDRYDEINEDFELFTDNNELTEIPFAIVNSSPFYVYIPQIIGITVGRLLHLGSVPTYYLARFLNIALYIALVIIAVKRIPFGKTALMIMSVFPMSLQQAASVSSDPFINGMSFVVIALALELIYSKERITVKDVIPLIIASVILAPCKLVYFALPFMTLLIPKEKFDKKTVRIFSRYIVPLFSVGALVLLQFKNLVGYTDSEPEQTLVSDVPTYSFSFIFEKPVEFVMMFVRTLKINAYYYVESMISSPLGWMQIHVSELITVIFCILVLLSLIPIKDKTDRFNVRYTDRLLSAIIIAGTASLVILSMFSAWTPSDFDIIIGVQGRYFLPVLPLIIPIVYSKSLSATENVSRWTLFTAINISMYTALISLCTAVKL